MNKRCMVWGNRKWSPENGTHTCIQTTTSDEQKRYHMGMSSATSGYEISILLYFDKKVGETREYLSMQLNYSYIICTPFIKVFMVYSVDSNVRRQRKWLKWSIKHLNTYFTVSCVPYHSNMNRVCSYVTSGCVSAHFVLSRRSYRRRLISFGNKAYNTTWAFALSSDNTLHQRSSNGENR